MTPTTTDRDAFSNTLETTFEGGRKFESCSMKYAETWVSIEYIGSPRVIIREETPRILLPDWLASVNRCCNHEVWERDGSMLPHRLTNLSMTTQIPQCTYPSIVETLYILVRNNNGRHRISSVFIGFPAWMARALHNVGQEAQEGDGHVRADNDNNNNSNDAKDDEEEEENEDDDKDDDGESSRGDDNADADAGSSDQIAKVPKEIPPHLIPIEK